MTRFRLLSKNSNETAITSISYNTLNKKEDIPQIFHKINSEIFGNGRPDNDLYLIKQLVIWLSENTKVGPGLSESSDEALNTLVYGKGGVCSDMAQIFNNFCVINDIEVREWGTTSAPFNRSNGGHSFNEVFIKEHQKWIVIDSSWGGSFYNLQGTALSVLELYGLARTRQQVRYKSFIEGKTIDEALIFKNYLSDDITPFLICNYRNAVYDWYLKLARPHVPVFIIHFVILLSGKSYHYKFPLDDYKKIFS